LEQLRVFIASAERQHMTRAAAALNLTQSAVSAAIASLEERHGAKLFHRVGRGIELTEAGSLFLPEAVRAAVEAGLGAPVISASVAAPSLEAGLLHLVRFDLPERAFPVVRHLDRHRSSAVAATAVIGHRALSLITGSVAGSTVAEAIEATLSATRTNVNPWR
jgi:DNA-binding transcriptional LysR family regulator